LIGIIDLKSEGSLCFSKLNLDLKMECWIRRTTSFKGKYFSNWWIFYTTKCWVFSL